MLSPNKKGGGGGGFFDTIRISAMRAKIQGEIVLLDREVVTRKNRFGIDLYTLLCTLERDKTYGTILNMPKFLAKNETMIRIPFEQCHTDVKKLESDKEYKELEIVHLKSARERSKPAITNKEIMAKASHRVADAVNETKLQADISLLERNIRQRKEKFGIDIYDLIFCPNSNNNDNNDESTITNNDDSRSSLNNSSSNLNSSNSSFNSSFRNTNKKKGILSGMKQTITQNISKTINPNENEIKACCADAKKDVDHILLQKEYKIKEMNSLK